MKLDFNTALTFALASLCACAESAHASPGRTRARLLMGTLCEITGYGASNGSLSAAFAEIARLEAILSVQLPDSELSRLNRAAGSGPTRLSPELWDILRVSVELAAASGGAFDPSFSSPPKSRGYSKIRLDPRARSAALPAGARLDFGAVGKGFALDRAAGVLKEAGVRAALLNFGGQILVFGSPDNGDAWPVSLGPAFPARLPAGSISSSGLSERPGHIFDPRTGRPVSRAGGVSVIAPDGATADAWSTALFVAGLAALPGDFPGCAIDFAPPAAPRTAGRCAPYFDSPHHEITKRP